MRLCQHRLQTIEVHLVAEATCAQLRHPAL
jgi:hypothetical protein